MRRLSPGANGIGIAVYALSLAVVAWSSSAAGTLPLFVASVLAGSIVVAAWFVWYRPVATMIGAYALLAPADALLLVAGGSTLTRLLSFFAIFILVIFAISNRRSVVVPRFAAVWFAALAWMIGSVLWASDQSMAVNKVEQIGLAMLLFALVVLTPSTRADVRTVVGAIVLSAVGIATYALVFHPVDTSISQSRVVLQNAGSHADPNDLAAGLMLAFALCVAAAAGVERLVWRAAAALTALFIFAAILATESRGGLLAALATAVWIAVRARRRLLGAAMFAGVALLSVTQGSGNVWQRFAGDATGAGRSDIWKVGVAAFRDHWLVGSGIGTFPDVFNRAYLTVPHHFYIGWSRPAHDLLVQSFTELGIVGGTLVLAAWWTQFRAFGNVGASDRDRWLCVACEAATLGGFIAALFIDVLEIKQTWVLPMLMALIVHVRSAPAVKPLPAPPVAPGVPALLRPT